MAAVVTLTSECSKPAGPRSERTGLRNQGSKLQEQMATSCRAHAPSYVSAAPNRRLTGALHLRRTPRMPAARLLGVHLFSSAAVCRRSIASSFGARTDRGGPACWFRWTLSMIQEIDQQKCVIARCRAEIPSDSEAEGMQWVARLKTPEHAGGPTGEQQMASGLSRQHLTAWGDPFLLSSADLGPASGSAAGIGRSAIDGSTGKSCRLTSSAGRSRRSDCSCTARRKPQELVCTAAQSGPPPCVRSPCGAAVIAFDSSIGQGSAIGPRIGVAQRTQATEVLLLQWTHCFASA